MEKSRSKVSYSIVRYSPNDIKGEIINVGALLYNFNKNQAKCYLLDENSQKLKAILENKTELDEYKSYKDFLEFYLKKSKDDLSGIVGKIAIASYYDEAFLEKIYNYCKNSKLYLSKPNIAYTKDVNMLFKSILNIYVSEKDKNKEIITMTSKKYMRKIFQDTKLLGEKVEADKIIKPIEDLTDLQIKIDFTFKNGVWNYMQAISNSNTINKNSEWFAKIQLLLDAIKGKGAKIHLLYKNSDFKEDKSSYNLIKYLNTNRDNVTSLDIDKKDNVDKLCNYIQEEGELLNSAVS